MIYSNSLNNSNSSISKRSYTGRLEIVGNIVYLYTPSSMRYVLVVIPTDVVKFKGQYVKIIGCRDGDRITPIEIDIQMEKGKTSNW